MKNVLALGFVSAGVVAVAQQRGQPPGPPPTPKAAAPIDLTGNWVSVVTEDWRWRMLTPRKGDYSSVPLSAEGRKLADTWDPAKCSRRRVQGVRRGGNHARAGQASHRVGQRHDAQNRHRCGSANAAPAFRQGTAPPGARTWQGYSAAEWDRILSAGRAGCQHQPGAATCRRAESHDHRPSRGIPAKERGALQRETPVTEYFDRVVGVRIPIG